MTYSELSSRSKAWARARVGREQLVVQVGTGTCGLAAGAGAVLEAVESAVERHRLPARIVQVGCIGLCYAEPLVVVGRPGAPLLCYAGLTPERVEPILAAAYTGRDPLPLDPLCSLGPGSVSGVPRFEDLPMVRPQVRIALRNCGRVDPEDLDDAVARGAYAGLARALAMPAGEVIAEIEASGLRGRGGAGFPTGVKWRFAREAAGEPKTFICNADEGDPGAFMDRSLLEGDPHAVLEGLLVGAYATGAREGVVYVRAEYPLAIRRLRLALRQLEAVGLVGDAVMSTGFSCQIRIFQGAGAFVCGEETALLASMEGHRGMPRTRPPFPAQAGLGGRPTTINNVETLANVSAILARGAEWFARYGTEKSRGTKTFSLAGKIVRTGLIEVPLGTRLGEIVFDIGGGVPEGRRFKAVQTGGPSGGCLPAGLLNLPVTYESLARAGSIMGSGGMVVVDDDTCMVDLARYFLNFTREESCGKCAPCRLGTRQMLTLLEDLCKGKGRPGDIEALESLAEIVGSAALCGLGQTAPNPVRTTLRHFRHEYEAHVKDHRCPAVACAELFSAPCRHACPVDTDVPTYVALAGAGRLDEAYRVLVDTNPFPSSCARVCHHPCQLKCRRRDLEGAVEIRHLKRYITDHGRPPHWTHLAVARQGRVTVVGAGPAGLTAARDLRLRGYRVTVVEARPDPGGMLRWGIPAYRLPKDVLAREIGAILALGIDLQLNTRVGTDMLWDRLRADCDAVFVASGAHRARSLEIPGEALRGVRSALDFLEEVNGGPACRLTGPVVVVGGGSTAFDAARSALRLGATEVHLLYRRSRHDLPAQTDEIEAAEAEGVEVHLRVMPMALEGADGRVTRVVCVRTEPGKFDLQGRRTPRPVPDSEVVYRADRVLVAVGQRPELPVPGPLTIAVGAVTATTTPGVFLGGDARTGPATVVEAVAAGRAAAREIEAFLLQPGEKPWLAPLPPEAPWVPSEPDDAVRPPRTMPTLPPEERRTHFREVEMGYDPEQALEETRRCLRCDVRGEDAETSVDDCRS